MYEIDSTYSFTGNCKVYNLKVYNPSDLCIIADRSYSIEYIRSLLDDSGLDYDNWDNIPYEEK